MAENKHTKRDDQQDSGSVAAYGGYVTRHEFELRRQKGKKWKTAGLILAFAVLLVFSCFGILSLVGGYFTPEEKTQGDDIGSIRVPTQSEINENQLTPEKMIAQVELSLVTLEVPLAEGGYRYGTGFIVSEDGYAVCAASLFENESGKALTAYLGAGVSSSAQKMGVEETTGLALVRLSDSFLYTPLPTENSNFIARGQSLYVVPSQKSKDFYGTVTKAMVASVGPAVTVSNEWGSSAVNMMYLDFAPNQSHYGAVVVDESGAAVGFLTDGVLPPYEGLASVIPIHSVYTLINDLLNFR